MIELKVARHLSGDDSERVEEHAMPMLFAATDELPSAWLHFVTVLHVVLALLASGHAILSKRDTRATTGWVGAIWLSPFIGAMLYVWLGINRIERRARTLRSGRPEPLPPVAQQQCPASVLDKALKADAGHLVHLMNLVSDVTREPLLAGNRVAALINGDEAYPAMLRAIDEATQSITMMTYIFRRDAMGQQFLEALKRAVERDVEVRVLVDDVGSRYSWRPMPRALRDAGITCAQFLPTMIPWRFRYFNLRNHRKVLVADGRIGFVGGINIDERNGLDPPRDDGIQDLHFRFTGPVVTQFQQTFVDDWAFTTNELLQGEPWFAAVEPDGPVLARGIPNGPDSDFETLRLTLLGAIACARSRICIVTPYFIPDSSLIAALNVAALRGVEIDIILPAKSDMILAHWASMAQLRQVLEHGCRIWVSPPPFDHTKLMLVDNLWTLLGSANWDPRSLRLNFEFNVECYDRELAVQLTTVFQSKIKQSRQLHLGEVDGRHLTEKIRDGVASLFSPYL
jgi:cardiolipin synthase